MSIHKSQLKSLIKRILNKDLSNLNNSETTVNLLLGTAAQESKFGTYIKQLGNGPALGIFQMERLTFDDLVHRFGDRFPIIKTFVFEQLEWDFRASIIMARIKYYSVPGFPENNVQSLADYYKKYYNTYLGSATIEEFINNYNKYVG